MVLDEIAPGAIIRFTIIDGVQYLSIRDFIMHMCDKDNNHAAEIWRRLNEDKKNELNSFCVTFKFPGRGQQDQPVITFPGAIKLAMFLPGENAKRNRSIMSKILIRYFAGDKSLIQEIEANSVSDAPISQMARATISAEKEADLMEVETAAIVNVKKRSIEDLEIEERISAIARSNAETQKLISDAKKVEAEAKQIAAETDKGLLREYAHLCDSNLYLTMDERAKLLLKDHFLNVLVMSDSPKQQQCITDVPQQQNTRFLTISEEAKKLGYNFNNEQLIRIGKQLSKAYFQLNNTRPTKHDQFVDGAVRNVNTYQEKDRSLIHEAIHAFAKTMT